MPDTRDVIKLLKKCNFIPIWAHPGTRFLKHGENKVFLDVLNELVDFGLEGLEAYYINHNEYQTKKFVEFANERNLFISCGSDYHGIGRGEKRLLKKYVDFSNIEPLLGKLEINELL
jgi:predicted metal-dependent phosphoesterase TrpH